MRKIKKITKFKTSDGKEFDDSQNACEHQIKVNFSEILQKDPLRAGKSEVEPSELVSWIHKHSAEVADLLRSLKGGHSLRLFNEPV